MNLKNLSCISALALITVQAHASIGDFPFVITASNEHGTATYQVANADFQLNPVTATWTWRLDGPVALRANNGSLIATLVQSNATYVEDPVVNLAFSIIAGLSTTTVSIASGLLSFPTIPVAHGIASSSMTLTDGDGDGASLTGLLGGKAHAAYYNGFLGAGTTFAALDSSFSVGAHGSASVSESFGFAGMGSVTDMSSQYSFTVSANDLASGTAHYYVEAVPEPATLAVMAIGALALCRRRR